jgi:hypothetical protein
MLLTAFEWSAVFTEMKGAQTNEQSGTERNRNEFR